MMGSRIGVVLCGAALLCCVASGAQAERLNGGDVELGIRGSFNSYSLDIEGENWGSGSEQSLYTAIGVFLTPVFEISGVFSYNRATVDPQHDDNQRYWAMGTGLVLTLNLPNDTPALPYLYAGTGFVSYGGDGYGDKTGTVLPMLGGGVKIFAGKTASLNGDIAWVSQKNVGGNENFDETVWEMSLGLSIYLGRD